MKALLLDTHAWVWSLTGDRRLAKTALAAIERSEAVLLSAISFCEIGQKVRLGKWPEMASFVDDLPSLLEAQGGAVADLDARICLIAGTMDWSHRDPFDRIIAATALRRDLTLVSADLVFDGVVARLW